MVRVSGDGADEEFGCISPTIEQADGSFLAHFEFTVAFLMGSPVGAGLVDDWYARALGAPEVSPTIETLGGQPMNRINCASNRADFVPLVGTDGNITRLLGRARKARTLDGVARVHPPIEVAQELLGTFYDRMKRGELLAPYAPSHVVGGEVRQTFVDPTADRFTNFVELTSNDATYQGFTAAFLFTVCNPKTAVPERYDPLGPRIGK